MAGSVESTAERASLKDTATFLAEVSLFARLSERERRSVARLAERVEAQKGTLLIRRGERGEYVYVIASGVARVASNTDTAGDAEPHLRSQADVVGWSALVDPYLYAASIATATDSTLLRIPGRALLSLFREQPETGLDVMSGVAALARRDYAALLAHASGRAPADCPVCP